MSDINHTFFLKFEFVFQHISIGKKHFHGEMNKICEFITKAIVLSSSQFNIYFHHLNNNYH